MPLSHISQSLLTRLKIPKFYLYLILLFSLPVYSIPSTPQPGDIYSSDDIWENLIYFHDAEFKIRNRKFLFSFDNPSPKHEKQLTIQAIKDNPRVACRFPARYSYLLQKGLLENQKLNCPELTEYKNKVAADRFYYIFASKNYSSITSMMGHGMIATEGTNSLGQKVSHAYSFFADLSDTNLPSLFYNSFLGGMDGALVLRPLKNELDRYLVEEGRELWQLELKLSHKKRELLRDALWELKDIEPEYLFHTFNCATLLQYTLAIVAPETLNHRTFFTSPLDIYRALQEEHYISHIQIRYAQNALENFGATYQAVQPTEELQDSSISLYYKDGLHLTFMSASHSFNTPQVSTVSQTALKIGAIDLNLSKKEIEEFALYEFLDITPKKKVSSHFFIGSSKNDHDNFNKQTINTSISFGKTWENDRVSFSLLSGLRVQPKTLINPLLEGYLTYKINDYTTITSTVNYQTDLHQSQYKLKANINKRIGKSRVLFFGAETTKPRNYDKLNFFTGLEYYF